MPPSFEELPFQDKGSTGKQLWQNVIIDKIDVGVSSIWKHLLWSEVVTEMSLEGKVRLTGRRKVLDGKRFQAAKLAYTKAQSGTENFGYYQYV